MAKKTIKNQPRSKNKETIRAIKLPFFTIKEVKSLRKGSRTARDGPGSLITHYCQICPFFTKWRCYLKSHMKIHHSLPEVQQNFYCDHCDFKTKWKFSLKNHLKIHNSDNIEEYKCKYCDYKSKWSAGLTSHLKVHLLPKIEENKTIYKCSKCQFVNTNKNKMREHERDHKIDTSKPARLYTCSHPGCKFQTKFLYGVNMHVKVHNKK